MAKKSTVDSKAEKMVLMSSTLSIEQLSNNLDIHKATIKKFMADNRPDYFTQFEKLKEVRKQVAEQKEVAEQEKIAQIKTEEEKKRQEEEAKANRTQNNDKVQKLMARKEKYGVTIMTPAASEHGDEFKPKNRLLPDTMIHKMNPNK